MPAKLEAPTPYQYVYNVEDGRVREFILVRENDKSFCVMNGWRSGNRNFKKDYDVWFENMRYRRNTEAFGATLRNYEQAMILCKMVFGRCLFIKSKHRGKDEKESTA